MMHIQLSTRVNGHYKNIITRFDRQLFETLAPGMAKMEIVEFTGSQKGDKVHIRFLSPVKADWVSLITEDEINADEAYFTDEGTLLPFPLKYWKHKHIVRKITEDSSWIIDDITFEGRNILFTLLLYPAIFLGFYPRKRIYRTYFRNT
ncbi:MAG: cyclase [Saprospiraceae bacterium]|nr:cyclase [Saprospiraceae bacterium]